EYGQLVTPQALYVLYAVLGNDVTGALNGFVPFPGPSWENFWKALQLWGVRYYVADRERSAPAQSTGFPVVTLPKRTPPAAVGRLVSGTSSSFHVRTSATTARPRWPPPNRRPTSQR